MPVNTVIHTTSRYIACPILERCETFQSKLNSAARSNCSKICADKVCSRANVVWDSVSSWRSIQIDSDTPIPNPCSLSSQCQV